MLIHVPMINGRVKQYSSSLANWAWIECPPDVGSFSGWWSRSLKQVEKQLRKGLNSLTILVAWKLWMQRNNCVTSIFPYVNWGMKAVVE